MKRQLRWFINRIGQYIAQDNDNKINIPFKIETISQAKSLYITQSEKGMKYK